MWQFIMRSGFGILIFCLIFSGCASHGNLIDKIPPGGFDRFDFFLGNPVSGGSIHCEGARVKNNILHIDKCLTEGNTTGGVSWTMSVEGYEVNLTPHGISYGKGLGKTDNDGSAIKRGAQTLR